MTFGRMEFETAKLRAELNPKFIKLFYLFYLVFLPEISVSWFSIVRNSITFEIL